MTTIYDAAQDFWAAGLSFLPTEEKRPVYARLPKRPDASGKLKGSWLDYQQRQPTPQEIEHWYKDGRVKEIALTCGPASNGGKPGVGLFVIDIDQKAIIQDLAHDCGPKLWNAYARSRTRSGAMHLLSLCDAAANLHNTKLAMWPNPDWINRQVTPKESQSLVAIETRGMGGYACVAPTPNYELEYGSLLDLPIAGMDEVIYPTMQKCLNYNRVQEKQRAVGASGYGRDRSSRPMRIIDAWRARYSASSMLTSYGYKKWGTNRFVRPGGASGSVLVNDNDEIAISFSSNDPLRQCKNAVDKPLHDSFDIMMIIEQDNDIYAALEYAGRELGIPYTRPDYSETRASESIDDLRDAAESWQGHPGNQLAFIVDDRASALLLQHLGAEVHYMPAPTSPIPVTNYQLDTYIWVSDGYKRESLAINLGGLIVNAPSAQELFSWLGGDMDTFEDILVAMLLTAAQPGRK